MSQVYENLKKKIITYDWQDILSYVSPRGTVWSLQLRTDNIIVQPTTACSLILSWNNKDIIHVCRIIPKFQASNLGI